MDLEVQEYNSIDLKVVMRPYESEHELRLLHTNVKCDFNWM